jgi:hypothetical protein
VGFRIYYEWTNEFPEGSCSHLEAARHGLIPMPCQWSSGGENQIVYEWGHMVGRGNSDISASRRYNFYCSGVFLTSIWMMHKGLQSKDAEVPGGNFETNKETRIGCDIILRGSKHRVKYDGAYRTKRLEGDAGMSGEGGVEIGSGSSGTKSFCVATSVEGTLRNRSRWIKRLRITPRVEVHTASAQGSDRWGSMGHASGKGKLIGRWPMPGVECRKYKRNGRWPNIPSV